MFILFFQCMGNAFKLRFTDSDHFCCLCCLAPKTGRLLFKVNSKVFEAGAPGGLNNLPYLWKTWLSQWCVIRARTHNGETPMFKTQRS